MKEINYQFRERLSVVHRADRRDPDARLRAGEFEIDSRYLIVLPEGGDVVLKNAARDLEDYFFTSMRLSLRVVREGEEGDAPRIVYGIDTALPENSYRISAKEGQILLFGRNARMAAAAGYYLEDLLNLREAPYLSLTDAVRTSLYSPRMAHSGYGLDMYPTEHIVALAHLGVTALLVFIKDVDITPHGYHDFNDLCRRAAAVGVDVYAYCYFANKLHPEDAGAEEFYEKLYGGFFDRCPYFKGLVFVGESCEFPSKDPNTTGIRRLDNRDENGKPLVTGKPNPGWWPCYDYPIWLNLVKRIVRKRCPDIDIVFWSYNWNRAPAEARKALIDALPKDVALQATFEMGDTVVRGGFEHKVADYTLYNVGPSGYFSSEAEYAAENGLRFYSMTNTGGRTWDVGCAPYLPAPYRWMERYEKMREAHDGFGLHGTMECHHYGFYPSFISELAKWAFYSPTPDLHEVLAAIVDRDFGSAGRERVLRAYRLFGDAIHRMPAKNHDQYGPARIGPSYPLVLFENTDLEIPTVPYAHFGGNRITNPVYAKQSWGRVFGIHTNEAATRLFVDELEGFREAARLFDEGCRLLGEAIALAPARKQEEARRILALATFIRNTCRTVVNVKEFFLRKELLLDSHGEERNRLVDEMLEICRREDANARDTIPAVEYDSALGYEPSMEYMCDRAHIEWKLALLADVMEKELPSYYEK
ncbi:MAG: hypothetical protein J6T24_08435 [Clostridia bacterium]|nr:hypothetical protein [Clostridia bacterium]